MTSLMGQAVELGKEGVVFEERFWRHFYRVVLTHASRKALGKLLVLELCCLFVGSITLRAAEPRLNLVVLIDLSASVATKGPDGKTDFQKNVAAVTDLLGRVPAGTKLTVLGITGNSFQEPDILLSSEVPEDPGYFGERLAAAGGQLARGWRQRATQLIANAKQTDILGALLVASQVFAQIPSARKLLVIYSDMRQATPELNLEQAKMVQIDRAIQQCRSKGLVPNLTSVRVCVLGARQRVRECR